MGQEQIDDGTGASGQGGHDAGPARAVGAEVLGGAGDAAPCRCRAAVGQGVRVGHVGLQQPYAAGFQAELAEERGGGCHRVDCRADVVRYVEVEQRRGAQTAADGVGLLEQGDLESGSGEGHCGGEAVGPGADDRGIGHEEAPAGVSCWLASRR